MSELRIKLEGDTARLGQVPAADVAQLILSFERALAQAAAVVLGKPKTTTGRYKAVIEQAAALRLVAIEEGSVVPVLELPDHVPLADKDELDFDVATLGHSALDTVLDVAANDAGKPVHPLVAKAVLEMTERLHIGTRYEAMTLIEAPNGSRAGRQARVDGAARERLHRCVAEAESLATRAEDLTGVLFEADFEKRTARLRTATQGVVEVSFEPEHDDAIHTALRQSSTVRGEVIYDPHTHAAKTVHLQEVVRGIEQLVLDPGVFWRAASFAELAAEQGAGAPIDPASLEDDQASEQEREAFMAAIGELN
jgi:hypothetical protein